MNRFTKHINKDVEGCWLWTGDRAGFYGRFYLLGVRVAAHRFAYELWVGEIQTGHCVMHTCDTPLCVNPAHLKTGTPKDNQQDRRSKGRHFVKPKPETTVCKGNCEKGSKHWAAKLTEADVLAIRASPKTGYKLAKEYNVTQTTISEIRNRKKWKHI